MTNSRAVMWGMLCGAFAHFFSFFISHLAQISDPVTIGGAIMAASIVASSITKADCEEKYRLEKLKYEEKHRSKKKV